MWFSGTEFVISLFCVCEIPCFDSTDATEEVFNLDLSISYGRNLMSADFNEGAALCDALLDNDDDDDSLPNAWCFWGTVL